MNEQPTEAAEMHSRLSADQEHLGAWRDAPIGTHSHVLVVGEDNPLSLAPENALVCWPDGCAGHRLQSKIFGLSELDYLSLWRTNLCTGGWHTETARRRANDLMFYASRPWSHFVLLGRKVVDAFIRTLRPKRPRFALPPFGVVHLDYRGRTDQERRLPEDMTLIALPHPSGRNTIWNDHRAVTKARSILRWYLPEIPWGQG